MHLMQDMRQKLGTDEFNIANQGKQIKNWPRKMWLSEQCHDINHA